MTVNIISKSAEEKIDLYLENFNTLLNDKEMDHSKLLDEVLKVVVFLMRYSAKNDKNNAMDREVEIWARVEEVKGTFNSKAALALTAVTAAITIFSAVVGFASAVPGTGLGNSLAGGRLSFLSGTAIDQGARLHNISSAVGQIGQVSGMFPKIADEVSQSERTVANAWLEETKQKRQDRKDSVQKDSQNARTAIQHARENDQKLSEAMTAMARAAG